MEDLIEALQIFLKYGDYPFPTYSEDEKLYILSIDTGDVSAEDKARLHKLGFFVDRERNEFASFRFG